MARSAQNPSPISRRPGRLPPECAEDRRRIEQGLSRALPPAREFPPRLHEAMRYSVLGGGKRFRGLLVLATARALGRAPAPFLPAALSLELIHAYSLVHDDLPCMDDDDLRRGKPTTHKVYGEGLATLTGDALLTLAVRVFLDVGQAPGVSPQGVLDALKELTDAAGTGGLIGGQAVDLDSEGKADLELPTVEYIHTHKTGAMIRAAVRLPALLMGAPAGARAALTRYGERLGFAFQIIDDCLNEEGESSRTGKSVGSDRRLGKATYTRVVPISQAREDAARLIEEACEALAPFGRRAAPLRALAEFVIMRDQ